MRTAAWAVAGMFAGLCGIALGDPSGPDLQPGYYRGTLQSGLSVELSIEAAPDADGKFEAHWRTSGRGWRSLSGARGTDGNFRLSDGQAEFLAGGPGEDHRSLDATLAAWAGSADEDAEPPDIAQELAALDSDDPDERDRAEGALARLARERQVRDALETATSAETRARLGHLLDRQVTLARVATFQQADWRSGDGACTASARTVRLPGAEPALREWAVDLEHETMERVRDTWTEQLAELEDEDDPASGGRSYEELWSLEFSSASLVSMRALVSQYSGGAHGNYGYRVATVRMGNGRVVEVALADWFRPGSAWEETLCTAVFAALKEDGAGWIENEEVKEIKVEDLSLWTVSPEGLHFTFEPYRMGCYAEGTHEVTIPWSALQPFIDPAGPRAELR